MDDLPSCQIFLITVIPISNNRDIGTESAPSYRLICTLDTMGKISESLLRERLVKNYCHQPGVTSVKVQDIPPECHSTIFLLSNSRNQKQGWTATFGGVLQHSILSLTIQNLLYDNIPQIEAQYFTN
ncbi:hypothetical protein JTB14_003380 [Gonioctena quinquepunctata]|nr:hypothetical protein JTB14_003380 [Gonioctena quinquepunctata]